MENNDHVLQQPEKESLGTLNILSVEDDPVLNTVTGMYLATLGISYKTARSGMEGLAILGETEDINALLVDFDMPGMNGGEFLKKARELNPNYLSVLKTGRAITDREIEELISKGLVDIHFLKTSETGKFDALIQEMTDLLRARQQLQINTNDI